MILHIDMDAFFASIEQAINPRLKGKPLIVGSRANKLHTVVCAASYEAKRLGIGSGMSSIEALKICPELEFVTAEQGKYIWTSEQIFELLKTYGFPLNYASIDEFQLDIGTHPEPLKLALQIQQHIYANFNITASVGIGKNWLLAKLASKLNKPNGTALINDANFQEVLSGAPLKKLCGMNGKIGAGLMAQGLKTCWDLYLKMPDFFEQNPGKFEEAADSKPKSIGHSYTLPRATKNPGFIKAWMLLLSEMVSTRLRQQNLVSKTVHVWLNGPEMANFCLQRTFQQPTFDGYEIYQRGLKIAAKFSKKIPKIRALGITCSSLSQNQYQPLLREEKRREDLLKALDRINSRYGDDSIYPAAIELTKRM